MSENKGHAIHAASKTIESLAPLKEKLSPVAAFFLGFFFGAIGLGIYLRSWKDFFVSVLLFTFLLFVLFPAGFDGEFVGYFFGSLFSGIYGAYRVSTSNDKL